MSALGDVLLVIILILGLGFLVFVGYIIYKIFFEKKQPGSACARDSVCSSGICKGGRCLNKNSKLSPGDKCTVGPDGRYCPSGYHCGEAGGGRIRCTANNPNGKPAGDSCATDANCASGICIIKGLNKCANSNGKLPSGTYCLGPRICRDVCQSGSGVYKFPRYICT